MNCDSNSTGKVRVMMVVSTICAVFLSGLLLSFVLFLSGLLRQFDMVQTRKLLSQILSGYLLH
jgi:hypothetical protein